MNTITQEQLKELSSDFIRCELALEILSLKLEKLNIHQDHHESVNESLRIIEFVESALKAESEYEIGY